MDSEPIEQAQDFDEKLKRGMPDDPKPKRGLSGDEIVGAPMIGSAPRSRRTGCGCGWPLLVVFGCLGMCAACCVLPFCALAVTGAGLAAILSNSEATQSGSETITLATEDPITLVVDNTVGSITVIPGQVDEVLVSYTKKSYGLTKGQAENELDNISVNVTQPAGDRVQVTVKNDRTKDSFWSFANSVTMTITVPESLHIEIKSDVGSVHIRDVRARSLNVSTSTGSVEFDASLLAGASSQFLIETNTGSIDVTLPQDAYVRLDARTHVGSVTVSDKFDSVSDTTNDRPTVSGQWTGTLGTGGEDAPLLTLRTDTGSIDVSAR